MFGLAEGSPWLTPFDMVCSLRLRIYDIAEKQIQMAALGSLAGLLRGMFATK